MSVIDLSILREDIQATIVDSLYDAEESHEEAFYVSRNPSAREMADEYALLADKILAGVAIPVDSLSLIETALTASEENCRDLGILDAADEYESARLALSA